MLLIALKCFGVRSNNVWAQEELTLWLKSLFQNGSGDFVPKIKNQLGQSFKHLDNGSNGCVKI